MKSAFAIHSLILLISLSSLGGCKKKADSKTKAIINSDASSGFVLVPVRNALDASDKAQIDQSPIAAQEVMRVTFGLVSCTGTSALQDLALLENSAANDTAALKRVGNSLFRDNGTSYTQVSRCALSGSFTAGPASVAKLFGEEPPSLASQAIYLSARGSTSLNRQYVGVAFYEFLREQLGLGFSSISDIQFVSQKLDRIYNPCVADSDSSFDKTKGLQCTASGNYRPTESFDAVLTSTKHTIAKYETSFIASLKARDASMAKVYEAMVSLTGKASDALGSVSSEIQPTAYFAQLDRVRTSAATYLRLKLSSRAAVYEPTNPTVQVTPDSKNSSFRQISATRYTSDGIEFFDKDAKSQKWRRTVMLVSTEPVLVRIKPANETNSLQDAAAIIPAPFKFVSTGSKKTSLGLNEASTEEPTASESVSPSSGQAAGQSGSGLSLKEKWVQDQSPSLKTAVEGFKNGTVSNEELSATFQKTTDHLPFGNDEDSWTDTHNCADIASAVCRSMYPVLPTDVGVGQVSVNTSDSKNPHRINYFQLPGGKVMVYDQQSGSYGGVGYTMAESMSDPNFQQKMKEAYGKSTAWTYNPRELKKKSTAEVVGHTVFGSGQTGKSIAPYSPSNPQYVTQIARTKCLV